MFYNDAQQAAIKKLLDTIQVSTYHPSKYETNVVSGHTYPVIDKTKKPTYTVYGGNTLSEEFRSEKKANIEAFERARIIQKFPQYFIDNFKNLI